MGDISMNVYFQGDWRTQENLLKNKLEAGLSPEEANADCAEAERAFQDNQSRIDEPALPKTALLQYCLPKQLTGKDFFGVDEEYKTDEILVSMNDRLGAKHEFRVPRTPARRSGFLWRNFEPAESIRAFVERAIAFAKQKADEIQAV
jgi:hypothetical protein